MKNLLEETAASALQVIEMNAKQYNYFVDVAKRTAELSTCISKKVGAVLMIENRIVAISYNGVPSGKVHCCDTFNSVFDRKKHHEWSLKNELHAEQNLIAFCAVHGIKTKQTTMFITLSPCLSCAKLLVAAGVRRVFYVEKYDMDDGGIEYLEKNNVVTRTVYW